MIVMGMSKTSAQRAREDSKIDRALRRNERRDCARRRMQRQTPVVTSW